MSLSSRMYREAAQAADVVREQLQTNAASVARIGALLREMQPRAVVTCARGSSDHAATFAKYLIESHAKVLTSSAAPSVSSLYEAQPDLRGVVFIAISQSGKSPDLLAATEAAKRGGALVIALCNSTDSPLTRLADHVVPLCAGVEMSVAATKSYIASLTAVVHLVASWTADQELLDALPQCPAQLEQAWSLDWTSAVPSPDARDEPVRRRPRLRSRHRAGSRAQAEGNLRAARRGVQRGRSEARADGAGETGISGADAFAERRDPRRHRSAGGRLRAARRRVLLAGVTAERALSLPTIAAHPVIEPMLMVQSFYRMANALAFARGLDPDKPPHLNKVTETV